MNEAMPRRMLKEKQISGGDAVALAPSGDVMRNSSKMAKYFLLMLSKENIKNIYCEISIFFNIYLYFKCRVIEK